MRVIGNKVPNARPPTDHSPTLPHGTFGDRWKVSAEEVAAGRARPEVLPRAVASLVLVAMVAGCTTTRTIDADSLMDMAPDDRVPITTTDGRVLGFKGVVPDAVIGEGVRVERHEIAELEVTSLSPPAPPASSAPPLTALGRDAAHRGHPPGARP
jgi:hypothetical protein